VIDALNTNCHVVIPELILFFNKALGQDCLFIEFIIESGRIPEVLFHFIRVLQQGIDLVTGINFDFQFLYITEVFFSHFSQFLKFINKSESFRVGTY